MSCLCSPCDVVNKTIHLFGFFSFILGSFNLSRGGQHYVSLCLVVCLGNVVLRVF